MDRAEESRARRSEYEAARMARLGEERAAYNQRRTERRRELRASFLRDADGNSEVRDAIAEIRAADVDRHRITRSAPVSTARTYRVARQDNVDVSRHDAGAKDARCPSCQAIMWIGERKPGSSIASPRFQICCAAGRVTLPAFTDLPPEILDLVQASTADGVQFRKGIRGFNSMFGFTSSGANFDRSMANDRVGVYTYRIQGAVYHRISTGLLPPEGSDAAFAQIYILDTDAQIDRRQQLFPDMSERIIRKLQRVLERDNPFVQRFMSHSVDSVEQQSTQEFEFVVSDTNRDRRYDMPTASEVAVLLPGNGEDSAGTRHIILRKWDGGLQTIKQYDAMYDPLHYVLLFPHGDEGWSVERHAYGPVRVSQSDFYSYHLMERNEHSRIVSMGRLMQEYVVDAYAKIEEARLRWIRNNQATLRADLYQGLVDQTNATDAGATGRLILLPSSFTGGPRYMHQLYQDAMAIVRKMGKPDLFVTMTCNPKWVEITRELRPGQVAQDRFDLCLRVFRMKLKAYIDLMKNKHILGKVKARVIVIEFQKRGLPHAHCLWILEADDKPSTVEDYDTIVCAELPDPADTELYESITTCMLHGPCGMNNPSAPCTVKDEATGLYTCTKGYPRAYNEQTTVASDGYPVYRRRDNGATFKKRGCAYEYTNKDVVPYNPYLSRVFNCHMNVEICSTVSAVKYLYKYVYKGHDRVQGDFVDRVRENSRDEPERFLDARYVSASEAMWRIFSFQLQYMKPSVESLAVHIEEAQFIFYHSDSSIADVIARDQKTTLTEWMTYNRMAAAGQDGYDPLALETLYPDFPTQFVWNNTRKSWKRRQAGDTIGRVYNVAPSDVERYYLRLLLHHVPGATSFADVRTYDGVVYSSYHDAAKARGLLETDEEFDNDLRVAATVSLPRQLRELFAMMLMYCEIADPFELYKKYLPAFAEDFLHRYGIQDVTHEVENMVLQHIERLLLQNNFSLAQFPRMPLAEDEESFVMTPPDTRDRLHHIIQAETLADRLNADQRQLYDAIVRELQSPADSQIAYTRGRCYYLDGPGGTGKTFVYAAIIAYANANNHKVLATASSGIAALLLQGGRTAHSTFKIPIKITSTSTCDIKVQSRLAAEIRAADIILMDEAPMLHRHVLEALDRSFRDIMKTVDPRLESVPFGGKLILLGGDFRQMLPVIPRASRGTIVDSCINMSRLWRNFQVFRLRENLRLTGDQQGWAEFLLRVGEGTEPSPLPVPQDAVLATSMECLIENVYGSPDGTTSSFTNKAVLTPLNKDVQIVNDIVLDAMPGEVKEYLSLDVIPQGQVSDTSHFPTEYLNTIITSSLPLHRLRLKLGCVVLLLRNLDATRGLCNGTRLRVDAFYPTLLQVTIVSQGTYYGRTHSIPRIALYPSDSNLPFQFKRLQFPVRLAFAMSINKAQGQTLDKIGLYIPTPFFAHGHLYVALSRTRDGPRGIVLFNPRDGQPQLSNVVFSEVFRHS